MGPDAARVSELVDRATAVAELAESGMGTIGGAATSGGGAATSGGRAMVIDLPLVDLDDEPVVDLADDGGAPMTAFWPCETAGTRLEGVRAITSAGTGKTHSGGAGRPTSVGAGRPTSGGRGGATSGGGGEPCGACGGCDRWLRAFRECGLPWPWTAVRV